MFNELEELDLRVIKYFPSSIKHRAILVHSDHSALYISAEISVKCIKYLSTNKVEKSICGTIAKR